MEDESPDGRVAFEVEGETLTVHDVIEGQRLRMTADREPTLSPALPELFPFPVDDAVSFEAESIAVPEYASVFVRDADGDFLSRLDEAAEFPRGSYYIEINGSVKTLVRVADVSISATGAVGSDPVELALDRTTTVTVGGRSFHTRPEATITVPDDPAALTEAVSVLGSSIKEFSPERSWPTLRGYPPRIERGDSLDVPSPLTVPDTGVEVVVRPTYADVYRLSTLSYYLGARMTVGDAPAIRLENGYEERLPTEGPALERRVEELLRTWFFLDTLARTEGYVPSDRYEYDQIGGKLPFYPPNLAEKSMSERLMEYLEVGAETVAPYAPVWATEAVLRPAPEAAELLPHLAHVLAPVRVRGESDPLAPDAPVALATSPQVPIGPSKFGSPGDVVPPRDAASVSSGTSLMTPAAYENRLDGEVAEHGEVTVAFLLADAERARSVRESLPDSAAPAGVESWSVHQRPDREAVTEVLSDSTLDIVFCGLPVTEGRIDTTDGSVDTARISAESGPSGPTLSVFENDRNLSASLSAVDRGSTSSVALGGAPRSTSIAEFVALLAKGSPIALAVSLAFGEDDVDARFVGDPATGIATDRGNVPQLYSFRVAGSDSFRVLLRSYLTTEFRLGREIGLIIDPLDSKKSLVGAPEREVGQVDSSGIRAIHDEKAPVLRFSDDLVFWSDDLTDEDVAKFAERSLSEGAVSESGDESRF
ncbi:hypothetical protein ABNG02_11500 [Halorubrum ejinorense]|uniref:Uncharacterized protein n=1 Tax=Halorubrum ejinorense TaxID=425309 RepID=A0AAV3SXD3_9EURY